ncbi:MAG: class I tRNA ligase family protein, partial [Patescibacteria group bacterium]
MSRYFPSQIEKKWQEKWLKEKVYEPSFAKASKGKSDLLHAKKSPKGEARHGRPFYNLMMFPYPSAEGLHIGGVRTFTGIDIYGRFKRMQGYDVFEPIGLDGFGINSENYALKIGKHPALLARVTEKNFYRQLGAMGNGFAWDERLETYDPDYYRWTQWIFVQMFKRGLAYRKKSAVNWCPSCKTVLANEQVIAGVCERCSTVVIKKELEQWFFKITKYADRLLKNLEKIDWSEDVKIAQRNWIGKSEGAEIAFSIWHSTLSVRVFTTRPDTLFGATYLVLAPEHELIVQLADRITNMSEVATYQKKISLMAEIDRIAEGKEKTGVALKGVMAINPANNEEIPVWISDYVLGGVGTGAIMAVPAHDQRDFEFAQKFDLRIRMVVCPHYPLTTCPIL